MGGICTKSQRMQGYPDDGVKILHEKKTKETRILERSLTVLFVNPKWFVPAMAPVEMPIGLNHLHSAFCWCDPIIDTDNSVDSNLSQPLRKVREFGELMESRNLPRQSLKANASDGWCLLLFNVRHADKDTNQSLNTDAQKARSG